MLSPARTTATGRPLAIAVSDGILGRVLDGLGRPIDGGGPIAGAVPWPVERPASINRPIRLISERRYVSRNDNSERISAGLTGFLSSSKPQTAASLAASTE